MFEFTADKVYLFVNGEGIFKLKADNQNVNFPTQFVLRSISNGFSNAESNAVSLRGNIFKCVWLLGRLQLYW